MMDIILLAVLAALFVIVVLFGAAHAHKVTQETDDPEQDSVFWL